MLDKPWILQVISLYVQCRRGQVFHWGWRTCLFAGAVAMFTLLEPQSPRFHFSPPKKHENGAEIWKYQEGAVQRAGEPTAGHQLLPTAEKGSSGGGSRPLLPLTLAGTPPAPLGPQAVEPNTFAQRQQQLYMASDSARLPSSLHRVVPGRARFLPLPLSCSFPNTASASRWNGRLVPPHATASSRLWPQQRAAGNFWKGRNLV